MANPSVRNGHIDIANELAEQFARTSLTGQEWRVLWVILRQTWGYKAGKRKRDRSAVSSRFIAKATGMKRANVKRCLRSLGDACLIIDLPDGVGLNQNYEMWVVVKRLPGSRKATGSQKTPTPGSQKTPKRGSLLTPKIKIKDSKKDNIATQASPSPLRPHLVPIALWLITNMAEKKLDSLAQLQHFISRSVRCGKRFTNGGELIYSLEQIAGACVQAYSDGKALRFRPTIETVEKKILDRLPLEDAGLRNAQEQIVRRFYELQTVILTAKSPAISRPSDV